MVGYRPRRRIAESYSNSIFNFWGTSILFSIVAIPFYFFTNSVQTFPVLHIFADAYLLFVFIKTNLREMTWYLIVVLICMIKAQFAWLVMLSIFPSTYWSFVCLLWRNVYSSCSLPIFKIKVFNFFLSYRNSWYILDINNMSAIWFAIY